MGKGFRVSQSPKEGSRLLAAFTAYLFKHHHHVLTTEDQLPGVDVVENAQVISPAQMNEQATPIQSESRNITTTAEESSSEDVIAAVDAQPDLPTRILGPDADQGVDTTSPAPDDEEAQERKSKAKTTSSPLRLCVIAALDEDSAPPPPSLSEDEVELESEDEEGCSPTNSSAAVSAAGTAPTSPGDSPKVGAVVCAGFEVLGSLDESEAVNDTAVETEIRASPYANADAYADAYADDVADNGVISASSVYDPDFNRHIVTNNEMSNNMSISWIEPTVRPKSEKQIVQERMFCASSLSDYHHHHPSNMNTTTTTTNTPLLPNLLGLNSGGEIPIAITNPEEIIPYDDDDDNDDTDSENKKTASTV